MNWKSGVTVSFLPFAFAAVLSWSLVWNWRATSVVFVAFVPMAFFFAGLALMRLFDLVGKLEARIKVLENRSGPGGA